MPIEIEVDYSSALTEAERALLVSVENSVAESVWSVLSIPHTRWTPWESEHYTLYILTPWNQLSNVIVHYSEPELRTLTEDTVKNDIAFGRRNEVRPGFSARPEP